MEINFILKMKIATPSFPKHVFTQRNRTGKFRKFVLCGVPTPTKELRKLRPCATYHHPLCKGMRVHVAGEALDTLFGIDCATPSHLRS